MCVSGNLSENFRWDKYTYFFFLEKNIILCILKGILPFKMHAIIYFPENLKKILLPELTFFPKSLSYIGGCGLFKTAGYIGPYTVGFTSKFR